MNRHVLAYRTEFKGDWTESISSENLHWVVTEGAKMTKFMPNRQYAVFTECLPKSWWSSKARYVFGLTDAQLYERKYGEPMPLGTAVGAFVQTLDRDALH